MTDLQTRYRVEGMDCAACASKITNAVRRVPGVDDVSVSVTSASMTVRHAETPGLGSAAIRRRLLGRICLLPPKGRIMGTIIPAMSTLGTAMPDMTMPVTRTLICTIMARKLPALGGGPAKAN